MAIVDSFREGRVREINIAVDELEQRLTCHRQFELI